MSAAGARRPSPLFPLLPLSFSGIQSLAVVEGQHRPPPPRASLVLNSRGGGGEQLNSVAGNP